MPPSLYTPYRTLGLVCDATSPTCPPVLHRQGTATFLTTPVNAGRALHLYDTDLHLKLVSKPFPPSWPAAAPAALAATHDLTFIALGSSIAVLKRLSPCALWVGFHHAPVCHLHVAGDVLISVCKERLLAWRIPTSAKRPLSQHGDLISDVTLPVDFAVTAVAHPPTYINKVLLGAADGRCLLLNISSRRIIHEFSSFGPRVTALVPSPVLDVIAVGMENGRVVLHNFRADETVVDFRHAERGRSNASSRKGNAVMAISFRSDADESMVTADATGSLFVWDLNERRLRSEARMVHAGGVGLAQFLSGEPVLVTAGVADNAVKVHLFDGVAGEARVLRAREGHRLPPTLVRFCGYDGSMLVSAGLDRELKLVSMVREARNQSFAQTGIDSRGGRAKKRRRVEVGAENGDQRVDIGKRLPPIIAIASNDLRERDDDFANIVSIHAGLAEAYTWRLRNSATHEHVLRPPPGPEKYQLAFKRGPKLNGAKKAKGRKNKKENKESRCATSVVLSPCGNYAIVGGQDGRIHSYNLQSGKHQGIYEDPMIPTCVGDAAKAEADWVPAQWARAHSSAVVGVSVDSCGDILVSAGSDDCEVKFWNMHARSLEGDRVVVPAPITSIRWCKASDLLAVACTNFCLYVYDASTRKLARKFEGHSGPITDFCFDPQGRRIVSVSIDSTIKTWDLPSGRVIDTLFCKDAPTSIAVARTGEYFASTHVNSLGISLWVDKSKFGSLPLVDRIRYEEGENNDVEWIGDDGESTEAGGDDANWQDSEDSSESSSEGLQKKPAGHDGIPQALSARTATMSAKPLTHWTTLGNLQAIRDRNKPKEPAKKPPSAPFFLPTVKGLKLQFDVSAPLTNDRSQESMVKAKAGNAVGDDDWANSELGRLLSNEQYGLAATLLRKLDASGVDMEFRTMDGEQSRKNAAIFFKGRLESAEEYELTQAHLSVFLRCHGQALAKDDGGYALLRELFEAQQNAWQKLRSTFDSVMTLSAYFSGQI